MSRRVILLISSIVTIIIGIFLIVLSFYYDTNSWQFPLLLGFGIAFLPAGLFAILSDLSFSDLLLGIIIRRVNDLADRQIESVDHRVLELANKLDISLETLSNSSSYLSLSSVLGVNMLHEDRRHALEKFLPYLITYVANKSNPNRELIVVGSSLKGLIEKYPDIARLFFQVLSKGLEAECDIKVLLTHPGFAWNREIQESRQQYDIAKEIQHAINLLESKGLQSNQIKVYKGSPTVFMIASSERMLLNFYPYQTEAFNCFALEVQDTGSGTCIYRSFYDNHFSKPWIGEIEERDHFIRMNSLHYKHELFDGPIIESENIDDDLKKPSGDFFIIDDEGTFYFAINLKQIRRETVFKSSSDGILKNIRIGDMLEIKFLLYNEKGELFWDTIGQINIDSEYRSAYWQKIVQGYTFRSIIMIGLFDPQNENIFNFDSNHPNLRNQRIPMFYKKFISLPDSVE